MATAARVVFTASEEVGTKESPAGSNRTKYGAWYGMDGYAWCAMFVSWVLHHSGIEGIKFAYTPYGVDWFKSKGWWHDGIRGIREGDVVFFDFPDSTFRVQHVGFARGEADRGMVPTIEGNTSQTSDDNGGEVQKRVRPAAHIVGYGRPPYRKDHDFIVRVGDGPSRRFERFKMAMQKVRAAAFKGKRVRIRRTK